MRKQSKTAALFLLVIHAISVFYPGTSYALTSGPSAPEATEFKSASITNLVDPFTGDFSYNIPLLDVDGYPINLAYSSGGSMDDEATWVGYGWNVNPGNLTRVMKGIPDDFNGTDQIRKEYNTREDVTGGIAFNVSLELFGLDFIGANASTDIFYNNQRGLGIEIGAGISATLSTAKHVAGEYTAGLSAGANLGITSNSQTGADFNFGVNMGISTKDKENATGSLGLRFGGSLNSRAGMKSTTLSGSFNTSKSETNETKQAREEYNDMHGTEYQASTLGTSSSMSLGSATSTYGMAFNPTITMPMKNESFSLSPQIGVEIWGLQIPIQATAHFTRQSLATHGKNFPAYGFLHMNEGKGDQNAVLDFNREKDVPYMESTPCLSIPYVTADLFTATSQFGSSQFKAVSNSNNIFFDSYGSNTSDAFSLGIEFGAGGGIKGGGDFSYNGSQTVTKKWEVNNDFLPYGDATKATAVDGEDTYFKLVGEKTPINSNYLNKIANSDPVKIKTSVIDDQAKASSVLQGNASTYPVNAAIARNIREPRAELFTPLNSRQATLYGLDHYIRNYAPLTSTSTVNCGNGIFGTYTNVSRIDENTHKEHHLSEITVTKADGMRLVYGVPVYNNEQTDVTMSVEALGDPTTNLVHYSDNDNSTNNTSHKEHYFSKEIVPAYATNFLISGVCSPDYIDVTGNGITDDDLGTAVRFNYSRVNDHYQWRTPNAASGDHYANFNKGLLTNPNDDKASYSFGNKELWYMHSIESKNMIAVFRLGDRNDGYGYTPNGSIDESSKLKKLETIDLYTKAELLKNPSHPTPIKSVHFEYDYSLFPGVPNNIKGDGKLTLKSVYFTYAGNLTGQENRYYFRYNPSGNFQYQSYDRWGSYKDPAYNGIVANLANNDFPYTIQDPNVAQQVSKWQLSEIQLPSGGKIQVSYESDDYAYVQNKRANQMAKIVGFNAPGNFTNYEENNKVYIQLPEPTSPDRLKWDYFDGIDQLYFKTMINLKGSQHELVSGYAKIASVQLYNNSSDIAEVTLEPRGGYHPIAAAAWQFMRTSTPELAFPYSVNDGLSPLAFVRALLAAIGNIAELFTPFEQKAMRQHFAASAVNNQNFARIGTKFKKYGGGLRVRQIMMNDMWGDMSQGVSATYTGIQFDYTKKIRTPFGDDMQISSGVASYEPMSGADENPFKQPITYQQKAHLTTSIYTVEEPLGESYFPGPSVGYSEVTTRNLDAEGNPVSNGYSVKKFYTAKDFPTKVKRTDLSKNRYNQKSIFGLFNIDNGNSVVLSQGFYVENNDMHGKPLSEETFDGTGKMINGTYYHYKTSGTERLELDNHALTLQSDGSVTDNVVGVEFDMFHDMREQVTENIGVNENVNLDVLFFAFVTIPIPTWIPIVQATHSAYESASTIKVINKYGIADKVTTIENGSTMVSENMVWDAMTGQVLLTKTQNGYNDPLYNFSLPAYLVAEYEKGMGAAYKNTGIVFPSMSTSNGIVPSGMMNYVVPGDELMVDANYTKVWVTEVPIQSGSNIVYEKRLITSDGSMFSGGGNFTLFRSGRRNLIGTSTYSVVSLKNPLITHRINIYAGTQVLNSTATTFSDVWYASKKAQMQVLPCPSRHVGNLPNGPIKVKDLLQQRADHPESFTPPNGCGDACTNLWAYNITMTQVSNSQICGSDAIEIKVEWRCKKENFPVNTVVHFLFGRTCNGVQSTFGVDLTRDDFIKTICIPDVIACSNPVELLDWGCDMNCCPDPIDLKMNPYYNGLKGNWRLKENYVYSTNRVATYNPANQSEYPTDIRKSGIYSNFISFYRTPLTPSGYYHVLPPWENPDPLDANWIAASTTTKINSKGQEVESKDALNRYTSAQLGFNELKPTAVTSNARNNEIGYDGFEDYINSSSCLSSISNDLCEEDGHFNFKKTVRLNLPHVALTTAEAHTGNYSLKVEAGFADAYTNRNTTADLATMGDPRWEFNSNHEMIFKRGSVIPPFQPATGKQYVLTGWIKGDVALSSDPDDPDKAKIVVEGYDNVSSSVTYTSVAFKAGPKVEGWQRVMTIFTIPPALQGQDITVNIRLLASRDYDTYFDDIRIHPYDANMKSFVYDYRTSRLMATLDENNYATFYEYNDEGQLLRNKKESEKGIITLSETRNRVIGTCKPYLQITNPQPVAAGQMISITTPDITAGSDYGLALSYWANLACTEQLSSPGAITQGGEYYIRAENQQGCINIKPVMVTIGNNGGGVIIKQSKQK